MPSYTVTSLIESVQRKGWLPDTSALSEAQLLGFFNDEAATFMQALLKSCREEFLVNEANVDVPFPASGAVRIPSRAVGNALRSVSLVANGQATPLTRVEVERSEGWGSGNPSGYYLRGNMLQLLPAPAASGTLRLSYLQRLPDLVLEEACGLITSVAPNSGVLTLSTDAPDTFTTNTLLDLVQGNPPFSPLAMELTPTNVTSNSVTFDAASLPEGLSVGDWVCLAGESPLPLIPRECHKLLATRVAYVVALVTNSPRLDALKAALDEEKQDVRALLMPRVTAAKRAIVNPNGPGMRRRRGV